MTQYIPENYNLELGSLFELWTRSMSDGAAGSKQTLFPSLGESAAQGPTDMNVEARCSPDDDEFIPRIRWRGDTMHSVVSESSLASINTQGFQTWRGQ